MLSRLTIFIFVCIAVVMALPASALMSDDGPLTTPSKLLDQMQQLAAQTEVSYVDESREPPEFIQAPVFRYSDAPRGFLDATMWVWTSDGRPVAFHKVEAMVVPETGASVWSRCFTSVSEDLLSVDWPGRRPFETTSTGMSFAALHNAPDPAGTTAGRRLQARRLATGFSGRIDDPGTDESEEMRLLPKPIFEYADPERDLYAGAVFGFATNGTNPDVLLCCEVREAGEGTPRWHYGVARMTNGHVTLQRNGMSVWQCDVVDSMTGTFETWMFFAEPREPLDAD